MAGQLFMKRQKTASPCGEAYGSFTRELVVDGQNIVVHLERKPVKNLNLRIRRDGIVFVSANRTVSCAEIDRFVRSRSKYVLSALQKFKNAVRLSPQPKKFVSGETFYILGRSLRLKVSCAEKNSIASDEAYIYLSVKNPSDYGIKSRIVRCFMDQRCNNVFAEVMDELYPLVGKYGVKRPEMKIKTLGSRWGSCLVHKGIITLNRWLISTPRCCIEYVMLHELCRFIHPNHSVKFYALLSALMPDWKERKKLLNLAIV
jgi:predicted metal-dependent hydrolase